MFESSLTGALVSIQGFVIGNDLWFEPKHGLNVVYGKNGAGKSTVINFVDAIAARPTVSPGWSVNQSRDMVIERTVRSEAERGSGRVVVGFFVPEIVDAADDLANAISNKDGSRRTRISSGFRWRKSDEESERVAEYFTEPSRETTEWTDERVHEELAALTGRSSDEVRSVIESIPDNLNNESELIDGLLFELTKRILQETLNPEPVREVTEALRKTVEFHYTEWSPESASLKDINQRLSSYGIEMSVDLDSESVTKMSVGELRYSDLYLLFVDVIIGRLLYELNDVIVDVDMRFGDEFQRLEDFNDNNPLTFSNVRTDADEIIGIVARAVFEQRSSPRFSIERNEGLAGARTIRLLFSTDDDDGVGEHTAALEHRRLEWRAIDEQSDFSFEEQVRYSWLIDSLVVGSEKLDFGSNQTELLPFYELSFPVGEVKNVPFEVFRLDDNLDIDKVLAEVASRTLGKELFEALVILEDDEIDVDVLAKLVNPLNEVLKPVSDFVASLGIGIASIGAEVSFDIGNWLTGRGIWLKFRTSTYAVDFAGLSTAQQFWVKAGMKLIAAQQSNSRVLVIADEPDRSLHERASYNVMEALASTGLDIVVSSHSVAALRTRRATLHQLEVLGPYGQRSLSEVAVGEDVLVAAERLGTTPYDLLSLKRMMVLVEGAHDAAVVGRLIGLSEIKLLKDRALVTPMRGVRNVVSAADSVLVTEFSDLNLLIVVDNGRNDVFKPILEELREGYSQGASEKVLKRILTGHRSNRDITYEERMLFDLLERAIHRGILRRIDLFALSVEDVIELLPAEGFGSAISWEELRQQYRKSGIRTDFKNWLRDEQQISVSVRMVEKAFDSSDSLHPELARLLQQIELGCSA